jgi:hypothetical protein
LNSTKKRPTGATGIPQPFNRQTDQAGHWPHIKPAVAQLKTSVPAQSVKRPVAPPVYKPQPQKVAQAKAATAPGKIGVSAQSARRPVAPPAFRPQAGRAHERTGPALPRVAQAKMPATGRLTAAVPKTVPSAAMRPANTIQRAAERVEKTYGPVNQVSWDDLVSAGKDHGLTTKDLKDGSQLLGTHGMGYPHFHLWKGGKVAFSYATNKNYKVGKDGVLDLEELRTELKRYEGQRNSAVFALIDWLFMVSN